MPGRANELLDIATSILPDDSDPNRLVVKLQSHPPLFFLTNDPCATSRSEILLRRRDRNRKTFIGFDPETRVIRHLSIPLVTRVHAVKDREGDVRVDLSRSHALHLLRSQHASFQQLRQFLLDSQMANAPLLVSVNPRGEIVDAKAIGNDDAFESIAAAIAPAPTASSGPISMTQANQIFSSLWDENCNNATASPPCIPYRYVANGCQTRASEICRILIEEEGITPTKNWIYASSANFDVPTDNAPDCNVVWTWHCAPKIEVETSSGVEWWVFDPSLFPAGPVSESDWLATFTVAYLKEQTTDPVIYIRWQDGTLETDPGYSKTTADLEDLRDQLQEQTCESGPAPYADCSAAPPTAASSRPRPARSWLDRIVSAVKKLLGAFSRERR